MKTEIKVDSNNFRKISVKGDLRYKFHLLIGFISYKLTNFINQAMGMYSQYRKGVDSNQNGALTPETREEFRIYHENRSEKEINGRQIPLTKEAIESPRTCHEYGAKLLFETLSDPSLQIRSALNIGCYCDRHFSYMAGVFPEIEFTSVDILSEQGLAVFNKDLPKSKNWTLKSGYALEMLQKKEVSADLVFMTSTSYQFNNKELDLYLDEISKCAKAVVITEYWAAYSSSSRLKSMGIFPRITPPEEIPENEPFTRAMADRYFIYAHNYPAKLEKRGFQIRISRIETNDSLGIYVYQLVAVKA